MAVRSGFRTGACVSNNDSGLYANLIKEAIQIYGHDVSYIDRTLVAYDNILQEDTLAKFTSSATIEMYVENSEGGFAGEKEILQQFGLENRNEITFVVSRERFDDIAFQVQLETATDDTTGSILLESGTMSTSCGASFSSAYLRSEEETVSTYDNRPQEGDLVWHPVIKKLFQVNFVDHDEPFYQLDNNPVYKLRCSQFEYASEVLETGVDDVDVIEDDLSLDSLQHQFTLEQTSAVNEFFRMEQATEADLLLLEDGEYVLGENDETSVGESMLLEPSSDLNEPAYIIQEDYIIGDGITELSKVVNAQNEIYEDADNTILDFSETNPFGDAGRPS